MLSLLKIVLPSYLQTAQFYTSLSPQDEKKIAQQDVFSSEVDVDNIESDNDFMVFLNVLRIKESVDIPPSLVDYALTRFAGSWEEVIQNYGQELPFVSALALVSESPKERQLKIAAKEGYLEIVRFLSKIGQVWSESACTTAAEFGHLDILQFAHENGAAWDTTTSAAAAQNGHLDCLQYLNRNGCPWDGATIIQAACGHVDCLKYALQNRCPADKKGLALPAAISGGHMGCVLLLRQHGYSWPKNLFGDDRSNLSSRNRCSEDLLRPILTYALADGWKWSDSIVEELAEAGYASTLRMVTASGYALPSEMCSIAVAHGHLDALKVIVEGGSPLTADVQFVALSGMHYECMVYAYEQGCPWPEAIMSGNYTPYEKFLTCLKFAYSHGCPIDPTTCKWAASQGFLDMLVYAHELRCPWDASITQVLVDHLSHNNFNDAARWACLEYALAQGCAISKTDWKVYQAGRGKRSPAKRQ